MNQRFHNPKFKYRGVLTFLVFIIVMGSFVAFKFWNLQPLIQNPFNQLVTFVFVGLGLSIRAHVVGFSPPRTSGRNKGRQVADQLVTSGMYSIIRHPLYLANALIWIGVVIWTGHLILIVFTVTYTGLIYRSIMLTEDDFLSNRFGQSFSIWKDKTPSLIPNSLHYIRPVQPFNFQKMLYREKNGWVGIIVAISLLEIVNKTFQTTIPAYGAYLVALSVSLAYYLIIKGLYKYTSLLSQVDH